MHLPHIIGVGGLTSNVGKTTLMCDLLGAFPGWEAIKTTRGHYRSCGKDAAACCVSHLLTVEPLVRSGWAETYEAGKDTGRYWDAGASNVHWVIATDDQLEKGIHLALERVRSEGVLIEGNSFSQFVSSDCFVMVKRPDTDSIKKTAKRLIQNASAIYVSNFASDETSYNSRWKSTIVRPEKSVTPIFTRRDLPALIEYLRAATSVGNSLIRAQH